MINSIPELIARHGSLANCCRETGLSELTIAKYQYDTGCEKHIIYNGRLMTHKRHSAIIYTRKGISRHDRGY